MTLYLVIGILFLLATGQDIFEYNKELRDWVFSILACLLVILAWPLLLLVIFLVFLLGWGGRGI
jgi:hypothetical protein